MSEEMRDYLVYTKVSFLLTFNSPEFNSLILRDVQNAFAAHVKAVFEKNETLREYVSGDLDFWCQGREVDLHYKFECHDESEAEAESFSRYCVNGLRKKLEAWGCRMTGIECRAEEADMSRLDRLEDTVFGTKESAHKQPPAEDKSGKKTSSKKKKSRQER